MRTKRRTRGGRSYNYGIIFKKIGSGKNSIKRISKKDKTKKRKTKKRKRVNRKRKTNINKVN